MLFSVLVISFTILNAGCLSQIAPSKTAAGRWISRPIQEIREVSERLGSYANRIKWKEKTQNLENGNWVYVEPDRQDCFVHWEVNREGIIIGYTKKVEDVYEQLI